ncbi:MAG TPA: bi-domain-containing oxidoreductase [Usitatibacter sp.]
MKQVLQDIRSGQTLVAEVPRPSRAAPGTLLIRTVNSLVSAGTERMLVDFGKAGWIEKARQQPDKVRQVIDKIGTDGLVPTAEAVLRKLDEPIAMGYCNAGLVVDVGEGVKGFAVGDRVASNGKHAHYVMVPSNLCAKIPSGVDDESAAFTVLGAVALQGIRLASPALGESVTVIGLGLLGLMAVQLLRAQGCRVLGIDFDSARLALAKSFGAETVNLSSGEDPVAAANAFSRGRGVDAVIVTTSTQSSDPMHQAAQMSRKRGRIVLVGISGLELSRNDFFQKELSFQVSCSYGPGRYDPEYEDKGHDYPVGFVRWTEQRNFEAMLDMMSAGRFDVKPLVSHRFPIADASRAYEMLSSAEATLGVVFDFREGGADAISPAGSDTVVQVNRPGTGEPVVAFVGSGSHTSAVLMPAFKRAGARMKAVSSQMGVTGTRAAQQHGIEASTTDSASLVADKEIDALVIGTRHESHAKWVCAALDAGKSVFVEKPLATRMADLQTIEASYRRAMPGGALLMVGFNRRFSPHAVRMASLLSQVKGPKSFVMTVNAGAIPEGHWTQDPGVGGGRIVGEACHFVDLLRFLAGSRIASHESRAMRDPNSKNAVPDTVTVTLSFEDGSIGTIHYFSNGHRSLSKERLEVFASGRVLSLDNFRRLRGYGWPGFGKMNLWRQDKGHNACVDEFVRALREGRPAPIDYADLIEVSRVTLEIHESLVAAGT